MSFPTREEFEKMRKLRNMAARLRIRQIKLVSKLRSNPAKFRTDSRIQLELSRVAQLCVNLGEKLDSRLEDMIVRSVMDC